ncbi:MAG: hypothetical protein ACU0GG_12905 [Paracoccaceae bacterium]
MYDFVARAREARWFGGVREVGGSTPVEITAEGMSAATRRNGYYHLFDDRTRLENGMFVSEDEVLHLHPAWEEDGMIVGIFPAYTFDEGDRFRADIGFLGGAGGTDGAWFEFGYLRVLDGFEPEWFFNTSQQRRLNGFYRSVRSQFKGLTGGLDEMTGATDLTVGNQYHPVLISRAGRTSGRDWTAWVQPRIDRARTLTIPQINCIQESGGGGSDELALCLLIIGYDERNQPVPGAFHSVVQSRTGVDSGEVRTFDDLDFIFDNSEVARVEVRMLGAEMDGAGRTSRLAQHVSNEWVGNIMLGEVSTLGQFYEFASTPNGPRIRNRHDTLFIDYWEIDLRRWFTGGRDPESGVVAPSLPRMPIEDYFETRNQTRTISVARRSGLTTETRTYTKGGSTSYSVTVTYT